MSKKKSPQKIIEDKLWAECRRIVFERDNIDGQINCYTCSALNIEGVNKQLGHCYPKGACGATMKYDLRNLKYQCYNCNMNLGGMGAVFKANLERDLGKKKAKQIEKDYWRSKAVSVKASDYYAKLLKEYETI